MIRDPSDGSVRGVKTLNHLQRTFDMACRHFPEIMEPHITRLDGLSSDESMKLMREALRSTFKDRWPSPFVKAGNVNPKEEGE